MEPGKLGDDTGPIAAPTAAEEEKDDKEQKEKAGKSGTAAADRPTLGRPIYDEPHTSGDDELIESSEEEVQDEEEDEAAVQAAVQRRLERVRQKKKRVVRERKDNLDDTYDPIQEDDNVSDEPLGSEVVDGEVEQEEAQEEGQDDEEVNDDCMKKDGDGYVLISRYLYDPGSGLTKEAVSMVMENATADEKIIESRQKWTNRFRKHCGDWNRDRVIEKILENSDDLALEYDTIEDIQEEWECATTDEKRQRIGQKLIQLWQIGYFKEKHKWKFVSEQEYMEERQVRYDPDEPNTGMIGCCARQASRSLSDVVKSINRKGKARHGHVITARQIRNQDGQPIKKRVRKKKGQEADPVNPVRKSVVAIKLEPEGQKDTGKETLIHKCMKKVASARLQPTKFFGRKQPTKLLGMKNNNDESDGDSDSEPVAAAAARSIKNVTTQPVNAKTAAAKPNIETKKHPMRVRMLMKKNPSEVSVCLFLRICLLR